MSEEEHRLVAERRAKLQKLRDQGKAFSNKFRRNEVAEDLFEKYDAFSKDELAEKEVHVKIAGRIMAKRVMGKASFIHVMDMSGRIQCFLQGKNLAEGLYEEFKTWDIGDIVGVEGDMFKTNTNELTIRVSDALVLTKSLRPLPEKFKGLTDTETRYRQRYIDLIMNEETRKTFQYRIAIVNYIRNYFIEEGFLEVETPMMQVIPGGATAKPFVTHHNALDRDMYLRVAPELYLKRLVVGGFERVFEINRNFRNEGLSTRHNPEFTMIEFYQAYADYIDLMDRTEELIRGIAESVCDTTSIQYYDATHKQELVLEFGKPFARYTVLESIVEYNNDISLDQLTDINSATALAESLKIPLQKSYGLGKIQIEIFEKTVEEKLMDPTFITAYPTEVSPLARRNDEDPTVTDRFEFFVAGRELANGFSELNDSEDQAERFKQQVADKDAGDEEAMHYDADYICALEYGLPPTAGEGIGIDRLVMLFTNSASIRDVLLFPHMRPE
ncbi:Lysyl-tRNA synthetase (class II) [hydrothermal vent metagenome]|uniref:lysine--tRNA ligase n=1 Tax=hydrothermal vent metagenome TaxID=652676 RepID=A0A3B0YJL3_9ZZZZ